MSRPKALVLALILAIVLISCSKADFNVSGLTVQPYVRTDTRMGLSIFIRTDVKDPSSIQMVVHSPDRNLSWTMPVSAITFQNEEYYGTSDIVMPLGSALEMGMWAVDFIYKDGQTKTLDFNVFYTDASEALKSYEESGSDGPRFDSATNLTVIP